MDRNIIHKFCQALGALSFGFTISGDSHTSYYNLNIEIFFWPQLK